MKLRVSSLLLASLALLVVSASCGSTGDAACDRVKTYCSVSASKDKDCRDGLAAAQKKGCESSFADINNCLVDTGAKCNSAGEMEFNTACKTQRTAYDTCMK